MKLAGNLLLLCAFVFIVSSCQLPEQTLWESSAHADKTALAFNDWNNDTPAEIPATCAKCHSTTGFKDFVGADGSAAGSVEKAVPVGEVIECSACHNDASQALASVTFPSGLSVSNLGHEAICMQCHQGRAAGKNVDAAITAAGVDADTVSDNLTFINIHYYAAAATLYGTDAKGGYEYAGKTYNGKNTHNLNTCIECHNQHSLQVDIAKCQTCHTNVSNPDDIRDIRAGADTGIDYDGDGNTSEGIFYEIEGLRENLYAAMQSYATTVAGKGIVYDPLTYPYFFVDTNGNGAVDTDEAVFANQFKAWTPRLLKAAYNYQVSKKDPGNHAHNAKYVLQLLTNSLEDVNAGLVL